MAKINFLRGFRFRKRRKVVLQLSNPLVTIAGVSGTGTVGTAVASVSTGSLTGVAGTGAVGAPFAQVSTGALTGVAGTGVVGTLVIQQGPIGVQGNGQAGSVALSVFALPNGVSAIGAAGSLFISSGAFASGVSAIGIANDVFPIPPAPATRPPLLIPEQNGLPASLWLGSTNGN